MAALVVEIEVRLERLKEFALVEAAEKHELINGDVPFHQRTHRPLVRRSAARRDERGAHLDRHVGERRRLQTVQRLEERLERPGRQRLQGVQRLMARKSVEAVALIDTLGLVREKHGVAVEGDP